jgi:ATP-dependent DNA ligase
LILRFVLGPDGLSRFDELRRRAAARTAIVYAFDLIEHDGEDMRKRPFLDRKAALRRLLSSMKAGILLNEHIAEDGPTVFAHACHLGAEGIVSKRIDSTYQSGLCRVWVKVRNPASIAVVIIRKEEAAPDGWLHGARAGSHGRRITPGLRRRELHHRKRRPATGTVRMA